MTCSVWFLRMIWSCWQSAAHLHSGQCCLWRGRLPWAPPRRNNISLQLNNTQRRLWRSSSGMFTKTCPTRPRRKNLSDRLETFALNLASHHMQPNLLVCLFGYFCHDNLVLCPACKADSFRNLYWGQSGPSSCQQEAPTVALLWWPHQGKEKVWMIAKLRMLGLEKLG